MSPELKKCYSARRKVDQLASKYSVYLGTVIDKDEEGNYYLRVEMTSEILDFPKEIPLPEGNVQIVQKVVNFQ